MWPFNRTQKRSLAVADYYATQLPTPQYTQWTVAKAVKDGYQVSGWVYLAINKIMTASGSVPLVARSVKDDKIDWQHPATMLLQRPNPQWSRSNWQRMMVAWLQLTGMGFCHRVVSGGRTTELWPISPDVIAPVLSPDPNQLISHFEGTQLKGLRFTPEELLQFRLLDPANPTSGIGPLQAAARAVDTDNELANFNQAAAQNRGVMDGIITIDGSAAQVDAVRESLEERLTRQTNKKNARLPAIIGRIGQYIHMGRTPAEMDFLGGRSFSRDEIYQIFGVPPVLMGVQESSTYNNMETAPRTFWRETIIPLLDGITDDIDFSLRQGSDDLGESHYVGYDLSQVPALKEDEERRAKIATSYFNIGVPVEQINSLMQIGLEKFDGWELPWNGAKQPSKDTEARTTLIERRDFRAEADLYDELSEGVVATAWRSIFDRQQTVVMAAIESGGDVAAALSDLRASFIVEVNNLLSDVARQFSGQMVMESRDTHGVLILEDILSRLEEGLIAFKIISEADEDSVRLIAEQIADLVGQGASIGTIQQAVIDAGVFDPARALMISRTMTTTAQSIGQISAGVAAGATHKRWITGGANVRPTHVATNGQKVKVDEEFRVPGVSGGNERAAYPGDPGLSIANRANCKCSLTFSLEDENE